MNNHNKENILLYCHSYYHNQKIINDTLRKDKHKKYSYCYNDINGKLNSKDIKLNLADKIYDKDYLNRYYKKYYNIIYMVFCPYEVYIDDKGKLRRTLFKNFKKLLHPNGVIITILSDMAKIDLLKNYIKKPNYELLKIKKIKKIIRKIVEILALKMKLKLLSIEENKKYLLKNEDYPTEEYYIFKKIEQ